MKMCSECNVLMIENCSLEGKNRMNMDATSRYSDISIEIPTGEKGSFLGFDYDKKKTKEVKARVCPNCGKVELYIDK